MSSLKDLAKRLRALPATIAGKAAEAAASEISQLANKTFDAGTDPYGAPWAPSTRGDRVTLERTGALKKFLQYKAIGSKLRAALGVPYAKYQVGKRPVFPRAGASLPADYVAALSRATSEAVKKALEGQ